MKSALSQLEIILTENVDITRDEMILIIKELKYVEETHIKDAFNEGEGYGKDPTLNFDYPCSEILFIHIQNSRTRGATKGKS